MPYRVTLAAQSETCDTWPQLRGLVGAMVEHYVESLAETQRLGAYVDAVYRLNTELLDGTVSAALEIDGRYERPLVHGDRVTIEAEG